MSVSLRRPFPSDRFTALDLRNNTLLRVDRSRKD
jgi:hypothetical protein